jgi:Asp-tRNA(Asn)/Glu-tRNA(Gln) amidotransferase A subunit family amidase
MKIIGSSGRSAAAIVLGLCVVSPGTKTCHSVVSLADRLGIIDYEQTRYLIPSEGTIYASKWMVTIGLLTRTVSDAVHYRVGESEVDRTPSWFLQVNESQLV